MWQIISLLCLSNLSGPSLKTKESNILECWRRFKNVAFLRLTNHVILAQHTHPEISAVLLVRVAQWIKKTIPENFQITILLINRQPSYKVFKNSKFIFVCLFYSINNIKQNRSWLDTKCRHSWHVIAGCRLTLDQWLNQLSTKPVCSGF